MSDVDRRARDLALQVVGAFIASQELPLGARRRLVAEAINSSEVFGEDQFEVALAGVVKAAELVALTLARVKAMETGMSLDELATRLETTEVADMIHAMWTEVLVLATTAEV